LKNLQELNGQRKEPKRILPQEGKKNNLSLVLGGGKHAQVQFIERRRTLPKTRKFQGKKETLGQQVSGEKGKHHGDVKR